MPDGQGEWLDVAQAAAVAGVRPATWRAYVSRGQAPPPDDPDDGRLAERRRPRWRKSTLAGWKRPGPGARTDVAATRREVAAGRRAELAAATETDAALQAWLVGHHRQLLAAAAVLVDQRDDLVDAAGPAGGQLGEAIDKAGEHMTGRPSLTLAGGVAYALHLAEAHAPEVAARAELGAFRGLRDGYRKVRDRPQLDQESGNETSHRRGTSGYDAPRGPTE